MKSDPITLDRHELYHRVWSIPASKLAKEFGVSNVGLAKICQRHKIPVPPRGYWQRLAFGKRVRKPPLPNLDDAELAEVRIFRQQFFGDLESPTESVRKKLQIPVRETLSEPHPLIATARRLLRSAKAGPNGVLAAATGSHLDIRVTKAVLDRSLRIFDALLKHWESLGGDIVIKRHERNQNPSTIFQLGNDGIPVTMSETIDRISVEPEACRNGRYRDCKYQPTGCLVVQVGTYTEHARKRWTDGKLHRLETMLGLVADGLTKIIEIERGNRLDRECEERQRSSVREFREAAAKRADAEAKRRANLLDDVAAWKRADEIRCYLTEIRYRIRSGDLRVTNQVTFGEWLEWATWYAEFVDPLRATPDRPESMTLARNVSVTELELTRQTRSAIEQLGIENTDGLSAVERKAVSQLGGQSWRIWEEICRILEALGYPVSDCSRYG